jgi:hypothetical protein
MATDLHHESLPENCQRHAAAVDRIEVMLQRIWTELTGDKDLRRPGILVRLERVEAAQAEVSSLRTRASGALWITRLLWGGAVAVLATVLHHYWK